MGGVTSHRVLEKCKKIKPYIKRLFLIGAPSMGVIGLGPTFKLIGISIKYIEGLTFGLKHPDTPLDIHL